MPDSESPIPSIPRPIEHTDLPLPIHEATTTVESALTRLHQGFHLGATPLTREETHTRK